MWKNAGLELQYIGSHSLHLDRSFYNNQPLPGPGDINLRRPNQLFGRIRTIQNDEYANYNGLTATLRQRMSHGIQFLASYTGSHTLDISSDSNDGGAPMNPFNVTIPDDVANIGRPNQRPNVVGTPSADCNSSHLTNCIDASAFAVPAPFTFGNFRRNQLYGPALLNTDFSLFKNIPI